MCAVELDTANGGWLHGNNSIYLYQQNVSDIISWHMIHWINQNLIEEYDITSSEPVPFNTNYPPHLVYTPSLDEATQSLDMIPKSVWARIPGPLGRDRIWFSNALTNVCKRRALDEDEGGPSINNRRSMIQMLLSALIFRKGIIPQLILRARNKHLSLAEAIGK